MFVPSMLLKQLYTTNSLRNEDGGVSFELKNRLSDASLTELRHLGLDGEDVDLHAVTLHIEGNGVLRPDQVSKDKPLDFPLRTVMRLHVEGRTLEPGKHQVKLSFKSKPFGKLSFEVEDAIQEEGHEERPRIPRSREDDYSEEAIAGRQRFVEEFAGREVEHIKRYSFDPHLTQGNCEHFTGVAQVPLGFAGPLDVRGEHADGSFLVPLATTEGTLVASYNRGIKCVNLSGGALCTVVDDCMQRAPVFVFSNARKARDFARWIDEHLDDIRREAEATSSVAKLLYIDTFMSNRFVYLRFNYQTGDAAGQNMVGRATFAACGWAIDHYKEHEIAHFYLESNFATDKKASQVNVMRTRGKRVTAEVVIPRDVLEQQMRVTPENLAYHWGVATVGAFMSGANNNGAHSPNAITAMFIATGQDVANVSESSAGILYSEITEDGHLYISLTIPSLIVATYGGGTSLPTQRECLELMGCYGRDKVRKFAEIVAGVALAGEISLGSAISSSDWVSSHESYGRNR